MPVRTKELGAAAGNTAVDIALYTCPAGKTAIVKSIAMVKSGLGAQSHGVSVVRGALGVPVFRFAYGVSVGQTLWLPYLVLEAGDVLRFATDSAVSWGVWASGAELAGIAP